MLGRPWVYALGAFGKAGPSVLAGIIDRNIKANMIQLGINKLGE